MKKRVSLWLLCGLLTGCGYVVKHEYPESQGNLSKVVRAEKDSSTMTIQSTIISDLCDDDVYATYCKAGYGVIEIPEIQLDNPEIDELNKQIYAGLQKLSIQELPSLTDGKEGVLVTCHVDSYEQDTLLSLLFRIAYHTQDGVVTSDFASVNIDKTSGKVLGNDELLALLSVDFDDLESALTASLKQKRIDCLCE